MSYKNTFITISEDSIATSAIVPVPRNNKPTIASIEYDLIKKHPYEYTQADVQFKTYVLKNRLDSNNLEELREQFFAKPKACFRASPLVKKYGWGIHYDQNGKIAIYGVNSEEYQQFLHNDEIQKRKGIRSKRQTNPDGQGTRIPGFTLTFIYGDYPQAFQYKIKFKSDDGRLEFEGEPF